MGADVIPRCAIISVAAAHGIAAFVLKYRLAREVADWLVERNTRAVTATKP